MLTVIDSICFPLYKKMLTVFISVFNSALVFVFVVYMLSVNFFVSIPIW